MMKIIPMAAALGLTLALSIPAEAAGISISPLTKSLGVGDTVQFTVFADDILSDFPLDAGGLTVTFAPSLIELSNVTIASPWLGLAEPVIDNTVGTISSISFGASFGSNIFGSGIALINFTAKVLSGGSSTITVGEDTGNSPFVSGPDPLTLTPSSVSATITTVSAVPLPAALPLLLSGLLAVRRRRTS